MIISNYYPIWVLFQINHHNNKSSTLVRQTRKYSDISLNVFEQYFKYENWSEIYKRTDISKNLMYSSISFNVNFSMTKFQNNTTGILRDLYAIYKKTGSKAVLKMYNDNKKQNISII